LADKPGSVVGSHSSGTMVAHRLKQPTRRLRRAADVRRRACLFGFAPSGVYLAVRVATSAVSSYLTCLAAGPNPLASLRAISTLPDRVLRPAIGGIFSVALSVALGLSTYSAQALPGTLPCGARTFLYAANRAAAAWPTPARSIGGWQVKSGFYGEGGSQVLLVGMKPPHDGVAPMIERRPVLDWLRVRL